jgi:hypothetical protein
MLQGAVWGRYSGSIPNYLYGQLKTTSNLSQTFVNYSCPTQAVKLRKYDTATDLEDYVNSLVAIGNTYHDIGMIWGARFISPTGIFASENAQTSNGSKQIQRHIIFMTDGDIRTFDIDYNAYGVSYWDRKQKTGTPDNSPYSTYNDDNSYNRMNYARLDALCSAVKNMNITLWVISYGGDVNAATETRLTNCATTGRYYSASNNAALISRFRQIASEIADLRLTK